MNSIRFLAFDERAQAKKWILFRDSYRWDEIQLSTRRNNLDWGREGGKIRRREMTRYLSE